MIPCREISRKLYAGNYILLLPEDPECHLVEVDLLLFPFRSEPEVECMPWKYKFDTSSSVICTWSPN
jgi:hypothetical protein